MTLHTSPHALFLPVSRKSISTLICAVLLLTGIASPSGRKFNEAAQREDTMDDPGARDAYFMKGRTAPAGKNPSELRRQAHQAKMQARAKREKLATQTSSIRPALSATIPVGNGSTQWRAVGPIPIRPQAFLNDNVGVMTGRVNAVAVDQTDATGNTVIVGGAYGGVWKSTNAAASDPTAVQWTALSDDEATLSVGSIAISPANHNLILVGTGEAKSGVDSYYGLGIMRSTDGGQTWSLINTGTTSTGTQSLAGLGFGHIAFNTAGTTAVASSMSTPVGRATGLFTGSMISGLWTSTDSGATWAAASVMNGTVKIQAAAHSVIYNPQRNKFYAAIRYSGVYQSSDGVNWTPTAAQPAFVNSTNCPATLSGSCPFWRGELAMRPGRDEMYLWVIDANNNAQSDKGVYKSTDGGASWIQLDQTGIDQCGDSVGCGSYQAFFNMAVAAVPNPTDSTATDLYLGAGNWFKCTINAAHTNCANTNSEPYKFMNITHVYGCTPEGSTSKVHPDQHSIDFSTSNTNIVYFGNDGGVYRTLTSTGLNTGSCSPSGGHLPFDNLSTNLGSLTQYNHTTPDPTDPTGFIAGAQDNGTSMTNSSIAVPGTAWQAVLGGDGGHTAINPNTPTTVYSALTNAVVTVCTAGYSCDDSKWDCVTNNAGAGCTGSTDTLAGDDSAFYAPFILDPQLPTKMLIGTCRVWRGTASTTYGGTAISPNLFWGTTTQCVTPSVQLGALDISIYAVAAGGPKTANGSQVIYAGLGTGQIFRTLNADNGVSSWAEVTPSGLYPRCNAATTTTSNPCLLAYRVSDIEIDTNDATGNTAYATVMGFGNAHVLKTTNGGTSWTYIGGAPSTPGTVNGLPDSPANTIAIDPDDHTVLYVGTDVGVFVTTNNGTSWTEVGPTTGAGYLPNVVVSHLAISKTSTKKLLVAATYGRGVWVAELQPTPVASVSPTSLQFPDQPVGITSPSQTITVTNTGNATLTISNVTITGTNPTMFAQTNACSTLPVGGSCSIGVTFTPTAVGSYSATVSITDNASGSPHTVALTGATVAPAVSLSGATLQFASQAVGTTSAARVVTVTNSGSATLNISAVSITGTNAAMFGQTNNCSAVSAGGNCTINVTFAPTAVGSYTATLSITDNATGSPHTVALSGATLAAVGVSPTSLSFGAVPIGSTSAAKTVTITNNGGSASNLTVGTLSAPYSISSTNCGTSLAVGANCTVSVTFTPTATTAANTSLSITATPNSTVSITGSGEDFATPTIAAPTSVTVTAGGSAAYTVSVAPGSTGNYSGAITFSCSGLPNLSACSFNQASVTPNAATVTTALTISTTARSSNAKATSGLSTVLFSFTLLLPGVTMFAPKKRRMRLLMLAIVIAGIALVLAMGACGGGGGGTNPPPPPSGGTTAGTYTVTITATSGTNAKTTTATLIVN